MTGVQTCALPILHVFRSWRTQFFILFHLKTDKICFFVLFSFYFQYPLSSSDIDMTPIVQSVARSSLVCDPEKLVRGVSKAILSEPKKAGDALRLRTDGVNIQVAG